MRCALLLPESAAAERQPGLPARAEPRGMSEPGRRARREPAPARAAFRALGARAVQPRHPADLPAASALRNCRRAAAPPISVSTPLVLGLAAWGLLDGTLVLDRRRAAWFAGLLAAAFMSYAVQANLPLAFAPRSSLSSLLYWLAITAFAMLRFRLPMGESTFFRMASRCLVVVAVAGLLQFALQFAGLSLFRFSGLVPGRFLIENQYNLVIPLGAGSLLKSNGFFLVEPSVFSQFMAIGIVIEALYFRRAWHIALFFAGLLVSASGTGWLVLAAYLLVLAVSAGLGGMVSALLLAGGCALALAATGLVLPAVSDSLVSRMGELSLPGSSGYDRFVTPFLALQSVLHDAPWTFFTGIGPGASTDLSLPFFYVLNTPVKILLEYGVFGLLAYLGLLVTGTRTRSQTMLLAPLLVLLLFTGGYHQFSPILFPVLLLGTVAVLRPEDAPRYGHRTTTQALRPAR